MKFRENPWSSTYESKEEYFNARCSFNTLISEGELETLNRRIEFLEDVLSRLIQHLPMTLEELSNIVDGYDRELEEVDYE